jgi:hypothetical protein
MSQLIIDIRPGVLDQRCPLCPKRHSLIQHLKNLDRACAREIRKTQRYQMKMRAFLGENQNEAIRVAREQFESVHGPIGSHRIRKAS